MRTFFMCGVAGAIPGVAFVAFLMSLGGSHYWQSIEVWLWTSIVAWPCVANSLAAILVHGNHVRSECLFVMPASWLVIYCEQGLDESLVLIAIAVTWLSGRLGLFMTACSASRKQTVADQLSTEEKL